jgi:deferrochelatase/peroxidase EfeB
MTDATRRAFLTTLAGVGGAAVVPLSAASAPAPAVEPFFGPHQAGVTTAQQGHVYLAAFDLTTTKRADVAAMLKDWTQSAAGLAAGLPPEGGEGAEFSGIGPARLTVTFGFGPGLFVKDGKDRYGLMAHRPEAFPDLPNFPGEQLAPARTGGDLLVQFCADNPQVAFYAARRLTSRAYNVASLRWTQSGFLSNYGEGRTARNLMGFKDGTGNPHVGDPKAMSDIVWVGDEGPVWMRGGSYVVVRRGRMALEHWERTPISFQEATFGRRKMSGAPIGKGDEFDTVDLDAKDKDGNPLVPENSHVGITRRMGDAGMKLLRRSYSYDDGANMVAERWPPWKQGMEFDAGLVFVGFQRDLRTGFIPIFENLSRNDMMNQFVTNTGGGHWACPGGAREGGYIGQALLEA